MKKYVCTVCGWVYDPAEGDPEGGIAPGTAFEDIPDDWVCPLCGVSSRRLIPSYNRISYKAEEFLLYDISDSAINYLVALFILHYYKWLIF